MRGALPGRLGYSLLGTGEEGMTPAELRALPIVIHERHHHHRPQELPAEQFSVRAPCPFRCDAGAASTLPGSSISKWHHLLEEQYTPEAPLFCILAVLDHDVLSV